MKTLLLYLTSYRSQIFVSKISDVIKKDKARKELQEQISILEMNLFLL